MTRAQRPIRRAAALAAACVGAAFLLTACIDVNASVDVNADATASGSLEMVLQKQAASVLGVNSADDWATQVKSSETQNDPNLGDCAAGETDAGYTYTCNFTNSAFTDESGPWTIVKSGNDIVFTLKGNAASDAGAQTDALGGASLGTMTIKVTMPGEISQITGTGVEKTSDTAATITSDLSKPVDVTITSASSPSGMSASIIIVVVVALAVIVLIIIVAITLIRRRRNAPTGPPISPPGIANAHEVVAGATATAVVTGPLVVDDAGPAAAEETPEIPGTPDTPESPADPENPTQS